MSHSHSTKRTLPSYGDGQSPPPFEANTSPHAHKKRKSNHPNSAQNDAGTVTPVEQITTMHALQAIIADISNPAVLQKGYQSFRNFLVACTPEREGGEGETGRSEADAVRNKAILREWLDAELAGGVAVMRGKEGDKKKKPKKAVEGEPEDEAGKFPTLVQGLGFASQASHHFLLSSVASALALLVRTTSATAALNPHGAALCRVFLEPANMKIIYRGITAHQDRVSSPFLRLLTEINKFNFGQLCPSLHAAFDFTVKDLGKNLESKKAEASAAVVREDPNKPSVRTVYIRFILSFFQFGTPSVKGDVLGQRALISPIFKYIKSDPAMLVHDILEAIKTKVVNDTLIPRAVKTQVFNEWVLGHVSALYVRLESLREDGDQNRTVAVCAHEFLLNICTKPGIGGVCFPDNGWYPQGLEVGASSASAAAVVGQSQDGGEKRQGHRIHNRTLAAFITTLKPFADTLQQDLLLEIFNAAPELVAGYFTASSGGGAFTFEPKLTATWIGYCTFLTGLVRLPLPKGGFGLEGESVAQANPPPTSTIIESILPRPCTKQILSKCITFENALVRFLATKFMVSGFNKLKKVVDAIDHAAAGFADGSVGAGRWVSTKEQLVEEFSRRVPDMATVVAAYNATPVIKTGGGLHREVASRLLMQYYELLPEVALGKRFDVNIALGGFLESGEGVVEEAKGMRLLEMEHLLGIAKEVGDVKWWNKSANMPHSSFTQVLKLCLNKPALDGASSATASSSLIRVKEVLRAVIDQTRLFQEETVAVPFEALLESLDTAKTATSPIALKHILTFLDDCLVRCVRTPFKYLDDFAELLLTAKSQAPLSPIVMTLSEQAKFFLESTEIVAEAKQGIAVWMVRFLENLILTGENGDVLRVVCGKLGDAAKVTGVKPVVEISRAAGENLKAWVEGKSVVKASEKLIIAKGGVMAVFPAPGVVDVGMVERVVDGVRNEEITVTTYDLAVALKALVILLGSEATGKDVVGKVMDLLEIMVLRGKTYEGSFVRDMKRLVGSDEKLVWKLLWKGDGENYDCFVNRYINLLRTLYDDTYDDALSYLTTRASEAVKLHCTEPASEDAKYGILAKYTQIIHSIFPKEETRRIVTKLADISTSVSKPEGSIADKLLAVTIFAATRKNITLDGDVLVKIMSSGVADDEVILALGQYVSTFPESTFVGLDVTGLVSDTGVLCSVKDSEPSSTRMNLVCGLVRKVDGVRGWALELLQQAGELSTIAVSAMVRALLDSLSTKKERKFQWKDSVSDVLKQTIQNAISIKGDDLVQNGLENTDVLELFRKAASLFPTLNTTTILKQMLIADKRRNNITPEAISFISSLIGKRNGKDGLDSEKKSWYLVVVDHLTRRFGEEKVLTEKSAASAKEFAALLRENNIRLGKWVPRASLNALLEAVVEKKVDEEYPVELASVIVSQAEALELDLTKLLQMLLGNPRNPLSTRESSATTIHYHMAYLIYRLFTFAKNTHSNITTMDSLMLLYRGTCNIVDRLILNMLMYIEGFLTRSCASRVATWTFLEEAPDASVNSSRLLISRAKTKLAVGIDEKVLGGTLSEFAPEASSVLKEGEFEALDEYLAEVKAQNPRFEKQYDMSFMLPILAYVIALQDKTLVTAQALVEKGALGYAILGCCSKEGGVRRSAMALLSAIAARLEESAYKARNQVGHLICAILASLEGSQIDVSPLPTVVGTFLAHAAQALTDPSHFLYEKIMELLLRSPLLDLWDIPYMLSTLGNDEDYYKEVIWKLTVLAEGLRTQADLGLYRKRRVFESCLGMYRNPYAGERTKEKVLDLLWSLAEVVGGGEAAVTKNGVVGWVEQQLVMKGGEVKAEEKAVWKVVVARLCDGVVGKEGHVWEWSKGGMVGHLEEVYCA